MIKRLIIEEDGQSLIEYGLIIGLIALVEISVLGLMGGKLRAGFSIAAAQLSTAT